jgi:hypothetical protein
MQKKNYGFVDPFVDVNIIGELLQYHTVKPVDVTNSAKLAKRASMFAVRSPSRKV